MNSEFHLDTRFEFYGSTIGVRNLVCYVPLGQQFNAAIQEKIPTPNLPIKLQLGLIGTVALGNLTSIGEWSKSRGRVTKVKIPQNL